MINLQIALILYALLALICFFKLHGTAQLLAFVIVAGLAAKTLVDHFRRKIG